MANFIQGAVEKMKEKGTVGAFGKATPKKIKRAKAEGGVQEKRAVFAENMKKIAERRKGNDHDADDVKPTRRKASKPLTYFGQHAPSQNY